jgi:hypothetical protein
VLLYVVVDVGKRRRKMKRRPRHWCMRKSIEGTICGNKLMIELKLEDGAGFKIFKNIRI